MPDFAPTDDLPPGHVHPLSREAWRAWLSENYDRDDGIWFVRFKQHTGQPTLAMKDIVEEAICWGWIDSSVRKVDEARSKYWVSPRKAGSSWSRVNKRVVDRMEAAGQMAPPGLAKVDAAKQDGSWTRLDDVENLVVPDDLAEAFAVHPGSAEFWEAFPRSVRRGWRGRTSARTSGRERGSARRAGGARRPVFVAGHEDRQRGVIPFRRVRRTDEDRTQPDLP